MPAICAASLQYENLTNQPPESLKRIAIRPCSRH
jgi:hypothetical protein